jgi:hypothetical protein
MSQETPARQYSRVAHQYTNHIVAEISGDATCQDLEMIFIQTTKAVIYLQHTQDTEDRQGRYHGVVAKDIK